MAAADTPKWGRSASRSARSGRPARRPLRSQRNCKVKIGLEASMFKRTAVVAAISFSLLLISCSADKLVAPVESISSEAFRTFVDDYFKALFDFNPSQATADGFHEYDGK